MAVRPIVTDVGFGKSRPPCPACAADWSDALPLSYSGLVAVQITWCADNVMYNMECQHVYRLSLCGN